MSVPRMPMVIEQTHRFCLWHRAKLTEPDRPQFTEDFNLFGERKRKQGWTELELACAYGYAAAALRYDMQKPDMGGMWGKVWNNLVTAEAVELEQAA